MGKMVGVAEFKARCLELLREMERDGEPITITEQGRVLGVVNPPAAARSPAQSEPRDLFGFMKGTMRITGDIVGPADPDWEHNWLAKWDQRLTDE